MRYWITHPKLQVVTALLIICLGVSLRSVESIGYLLLIGLGFLAICRVPFLLFWSRLRLILPFSIVTLIFFPFYESGQGWELFGGLSISLYGLEKAGLYTGRLLFVTQILTLLFHQVSIPLFLQVLHQLKVPSILIELILFSLRFMAVLAEEAGSMYRATRSRGLTVGSWFSIRSYRVLASLLGSLLVRGLRRSENIYFGMLARGYRGIVGTVQFSTVSVADWLKAVISCAIVLYLFIQERM